MNWKNGSPAGAFAVLGLGMTLGVMACSTSGGGGVPVDGAGLMRSDVDRMSLREQFALVGERDARIYEVLAEAQLQISDEPWSWLNHGVIPTAGCNAWLVRGMNDDNSYFLDVGAAIHPEGARGESADVDPMVEYFESKGWPFEIEHESEFRHTIRADTGDGFLVSWTVQPNGQYNMIVTSKSYWGDARGLLREVADRIPKGSLDTGDAVPGVRPPFPSWDDPATNAPRLLDD